MYKIMKFYPNMSLKNHISVNIWRAIFFTYAVNTKYVRLKIDLESKNKQFSVYKSFFQDKINFFAKYDTQLLHAKFVRVNKFKNKYFDKSYISLDFRLFNRP